MREVLPQRLWIGTAHDARDLRMLHATGIEAVVDLAIEESPALLPRELISCRFPLRDGTGNSPQVIEIAMSTIQQLVRRNVPTLVSCSAGLSRSPAIVACVLAIEQHETADAALRRLALTGHSDVSPGLWSELKTLECSPSQPVETSANPPNFVSTSMRCERVEAVLRSSLPEQNQRTAPNLK